jgi:hypothetical protein
MNANRRAITKWTIAAFAALWLGACATPAPMVPATPQPALAAMVSPYAAELRTAGVRSVQVFENGARIRTATQYGEVYVRYPSGLSPTGFIVYVDAQAVDVDSDTFNAGNSTQYDAAIKRIIPEVLRLVTANNRFAIEQGMGMGGGGGRR